MAPFALLVETGEVDQENKVLKFDAESLRAITNKIVTALGLQGEAAWEYWDKDFDTWLSPDDFDALPRKARIRILRSGDDSGAAGAAGGAGTGADDAAEDDAARVGGSKEEKAAALGHDQLAVGRDDGRIREGDAIPEEWRAVAARTRQAYPGNNCAEAAAADTPVSRGGCDPTIKALCLDCPAAEPSLSGSVAPAPPCVFPGGVHDWELSRLRQTGGGRPEFTKPNLLSFENNHLRGARHIKNIGLLTRLTAITTSQPSSNDPPYYESIRALASPPTAETAAAPTAKTASLPPPAKRARGACDEVSVEEPEETESQKALSDFLSWARQVIPLATESDTKPGRASLKSGSSSGLFAGTGCCGRGGAKRRDAPLHAAGVR